MLNEIISHIHYNFATGGTSLYPLRLLLFASFLRFLRPFYAKFKNHITIMIMLKVSTKFGYDFDCLLRWGDEVQEDYRRRNILNTESGLINSASEGIITVIKELNENNIKIDSQLRTIENRQDQLLQIMLEQNRIIAEQGKQLATQTEMLFNIPCYFSLEYFVFVTRNWQYTEAS